MKKALNVAFCCLIISLLILVFSLYFNKKYKVDNDENQASEKSIEKEKLKEQLFSLSLVATGDALIHQAIYNSAYKNGIYDFKPKLELIKPIIKNHDLAFYNQETIFGGAELGYSHYPRFNTPSEFGDAMIDAGFNLIALSNNHSFDKGEKGVLNAIDYWNIQDVIFNGINNSFKMQEEIQIMTKNNISYALLSYTTTNNGLATPQGKEYLVNYYSEESAKKDIEYLKEKEVDVIIVSMHWGNEYTHKPNEEQIKIANFLSEQEVSIIIGHHPHVLQPIEKIGKTLVMYSLGNFISAQKGVERLTGTLVSVDIKKTVIDKLSEINIEVKSVELTFTDKTKSYIVIPFSQMNETYLKDYKKAYNNAKEIITSSDKSINVVPLP